MNPVKRKKIQEFAEKMHDDFELQIPVDAKTVAKRFGGRIIETKTDLPEEIDAKIDKEGETFKITINANAKRPNTRNNFTIAHELGHLFLHMGYKFNPEQWENVNKYTDSAYYRFGHGEEELEANEFAAAFLMPEKKYREVVKDFTEKGICQIVEVAKRFDVSLEAALNRGRWLGIFSWE
ncbi:MAG TPA: ImmA/IrrE family metallo-endopeptidase [Candidatus Kapabacteria bacterium]|nr:ImmA/IrrE family metallo-endopeptidase [Candidatus Kapabacteria bacterium]